MPRYSCISLCLVAFTACACPAPPPGEAAAPELPAPSTPSTPPADAPAASGGLAALEFMTGSWASTTPEGQTEEMWTAPRGGTMLGVGRVVAGERTAFFEFMTIEEQAEGIVLTAMPRGAKGVPFKLVEIQGGQAIFANPDHDFPKRIIYRKEPNGMLAARVDGGPEPNAKAESYRYVRVMQQPGGVTSRRSHPSRMRRAP
jgi:hypothetical protein